MKNWLILFVLAFSFLSCSNDDDETREENRLAIESYLAANNIDAIETDSGLFYSVEVQGNGEFPFLQDRVTVLYSGYNLAGEVFDEATEPVDFQLLGVIQGWQEGMRKFSIGGSGKLFVPAHLAYNENEPSFGEPIVFDVTLVDIN